MTDEERDDIPLEPWAFGMEMRDVLFVREFLVDLKAMPAAIRSGYYATESSAQAHSHRLLRRPVILKAIALAMEERASAVKITAQTVLGEAWRCYLECVGERNWAAAKGFLELAGKHVDVRAFRERFGRGTGADGDEDDEDVDASGLANLSDEELETLARLSRKAAGIDEPEGSPSPLRH